MIKPIAVLISDVHYNLQTLPLADAAMRQAIAKVNELNVPLIVAGDLHDTKANIRAECINTMLDTFNQLNQTCFILRGNHDAVNEKSKEHALSFLERECTYSDSIGVDLPAREIISTPWFRNELGTINGNSIHLIPYHHDKEELRQYLKEVDKNSCIIMHQGLTRGVTDVNPGEYIQDKSALNPEDVDSFRIISGHYHTRQTIKTRSMPRCVGGSWSALQDEYALHAKGIGTWDYIGNPYTLTYAETNDPEKGFQILMSDGTLQFIPTNLRKHVILEADYQDEINKKLSYYTNEDLIWLKVRGPRDGLVHFDSSKLIRNCRIEFIFKDNLPAIFNDDEKLADNELLDKIIDRKLEVSEKGRTRIKQLWKEF